MEENISLQNFPSQNSTEVVQNADSPADEDAVDKEMLDKVAKIEKKECFANFSTQH